MRKKVNFFVVILALLSIAFTPSFAQDNGKSKKKKAEVKTPKLFSGLKSYNSTYIGVHGGATIATTPFNAPSEEDYGNAQTAIGMNLSFRQLISQNVGFQLELFRGRLKGDNAGELNNARNGIRSFETQITLGLSGFAYFNMFNINILSKLPEIRFFTKFGAGIMYLKPTYVDATTLRTVSLYSEARRDGFFAAGAGVRIRINNNLDFVGDFTMSFTRDDILDGNVRTPNNFGDRMSYVSGGLSYALPSKTKPNLDWINSAKSLYDELKDTTLVKRVTKVEKDIKVLKSDVSAVQGEVSEIKTDSDNDGVSNVFDKCPNTPAGVKVDGAGCPLDVDGDGVFDSNDDCPTVKGPASNNGCPVDEDVPTFDDEELDKLQKAFINLEFAFNSAQINNASFEYLDGLADVLSKREDVKLIVHGYTDNIGTDEYNQSLSDRRAEAVKRYLVSKGVSADAIEPKGHGETAPVADNENDEGRQKNRRVEFELVKK